MLDHKRALRKESQIADSIKKKEDSFWSKQMNTVRSQAAKEEGSLNNKVQSAVTQSAKVSNEAMHDEKLMQKKLMGLKSMKAEAKVVEAVKVHKNDAEITEDNVRLQKENADLHEQLGVWQKKAAQFASAQEGQKNANKRLVRLIHKVSREREDSDKVAQAATAKADLANAKLGDRKRKLNFTKPGSKETSKETINGRIKTSTLGKLGPSKTKGVTKTKPGGLMGRAAVNVAKP